MKARALLLAFCAASTVARAEEPDWFDAFSGKAFLQGDASFVAREKSAAPNAPPLFRARWVVLRYSGFAESERRYWPYRNMLLVTTPAGARYVLESSFGFVDQSHLDEERPWQRVASGKAVFEVWSSGTAGEPGAAVSDPGPCEGDRHRVRAAGGTLAFFLHDLGSPTVRATLEEISAATFSEDEVRDLSLLLKVSVENSASLSSELPFFHMRDSLLSVFTALRGRVPSREQRTVSLAPDPAPPGDLAEWRGLAHLPLDLPPFPVLQPEKPIQ